MFRYTHLLLITANIITISNTSALELTLEQFVELNCKIDIRITPFLLPEKMVIRKAIAMLKLPNLHNRYRTIDALRTLGGKSKTLLEVMIRINRALYKHNQVYALVHLDPGLIQMHKKQLFTAILHSQAPEALKALQANGSFTC